MSESEKFIAFRLGEYLYRFESSNDYFNKISIANTIVNLYYLLGVEKDIFVDKFKIIIL